MYLEGLAALNSNDYLILASTFHSIHAIASRISPLDGPSSGIETIEAETFKMNCFQTPTGKTSFSPPSFSRRVSWWVRGIKTNRD